MIIGIMGKKRAGKDTVANIIIGLLGEGEKVSFAFALKNILSKVCGENFFVEEGREDVRTFCLDLALLEELTGLSNLTVADFASIASMAPSLSSEGKLTLTTSMRKILQHVGTELCRNRLGDNYWVDRLEIPTHTETVVVTDVRFASEAQKIVDLGGYTIEVKNSRVDVCSDAHSSEQVPSIWADYVVQNDSDLHNLRKEAIIVLGRILANE